MNIGGASTVRTIVGSDANNARQRSAPRQAIANRTQVSSQKPTKSFGRRAVELIANGGARSPSRSCRITWAPEGIATSIARVSVHAPQENAALNARLSLAALGQDQPWRAL